MPVHKKYRPMSCFSAQRRLETSLRSNGARLVAELARTCSKRGMPAGTFGMKRIWPGR